MTHELTSDERDRLARMCGGKLDKSLYLKHKSNSKFWVFPGQVLDVAERDWLPDQDANHVMMVLEAMRKDHIVIIRNSCLAKESYVWVRWYPNYGGEECGRDISRPTFGDAVCQAALEVDGGEK